MVEGSSYSWSPPGLSTARVEEYMRQLPIEKVPRVGGSQGELYRDHQLKLQLPKQDLSSKYCSNLEPGHQVGQTAQSPTPHSLSLLGQLQCICQFS